jgi:hypothetical protein
MKRDNDLGRDSMPINPITLDKIEYNVIKHIESKVVDRIVHDTKNAASTNKDSSNSNRNFNSKQQEHASQQFSQYLSRFKIKLEYKILKGKIKIKLKDIDGKVLIETEVEDVEKLFDGIKKETGNIIDLKG